MKRIGRFLIRVLALALAILLVILGYPVLKGWVSSLLPQAKYEQISQLISHEMEVAGEMTVVRHADTGLMTASTNALILGEVQSVKVPYAYEVGLGFKMADVRLEPGEDGIAVYVPAIDILYDSFEVTGEPEIRDFWYRLTEQRYQEMLDEQARKCRAEYEENDDYALSAWDEACETLRNLFESWAGQKLALRFYRG